LAAPASATEPTVGEPATIVVAAGGSPAIWLAVALLICSVFLVLLELHLPTHGILGLGGVIAFLLGGFLLLATPATAGPVLALIEAHGSLLLAASVLFAGFGVVMVRAGLRARRLPVRDPLVRLSGARGVAASPLAPSGTVLVLNERWSAVATGAPVRPGEEVEVVARDGLTLRVRRTTPVGAMELDGLPALPAQGQVRPGVWVERAR
jgi:membrane-bound serine protease (ClpP class)